MHVAPTDFRSVRRDGLTLHFALLESRVWVVAEFPASGSRGTFVEAWCERPHWGLALAGDVELELDDERHLVAPGTAFHVPSGIRHRMTASANARVAALATPEGDESLDGEWLQGAGFEVHRPAVPLGPEAVGIVKPRPRRPPASGEIVAEAQRMGELLLTRTRFGRRAGYTSQPCDLPHWGVVTVGSIAIEWEDDVEVVGAGDVFHCPAGPPGHRIQAAEAATIVDFTPLDAILPGDRAPSWRLEAAAEALRRGDESGGRRLELTALG